MKTQFNSKKFIFITTISVAVLLLVIYFLSVINGHNKLCNPFISGCSDITSSGLYPFESYILKAVLIPTAIFIIIIFFFIKEWLIQISDNKKSIIKQSNIIFFLAILGCAGLIIGTSVIDGINTPMQLHIKAVAMFFVLITICQIWYTIIEYSYINKINKFPIILRYLLLIITMIVSIWSIFMTQTYENYSVVEWWGVYALVFWLWTFSINKKICF